MKISVVIPVHNAGKFLKECVESILAQSCEDWELILVENGSTDNSLAICREYCENYPDRIRLIVSDVADVSAARNRGIEAAMGEYLVFCDADDCYAPTSFQTLLAIAEERGADIVSGQFCYKRERCYAAGDVHWQRAREALNDTLYQKKYTHFSLCAKLFKTSLFHDTLLVDGRKYEDLEITSRLYLKATTTATTTAPIYFYRQHRDSFINHWSERRVDALWAVDTIENTMYHEAPALLKAAESRVFSAYFNIFILSNLNGRKYLAEQCAKKIKALRWAVLWDKNVRLKNRIAALLSYCGGLKIFSSVCNCLSMSRSRRDA